MEIRAYREKDLATFWDESKRLVNPHKVYVDLSKKLFKMKRDLLDEKSGLTDDDQG